MVHYLRHGHFTVYIFFQIKKKYPLPYNTVYYKLETCTCIFGMNKILCKQI